MQEMVLDKIRDSIRPRYLVYDIMQFEVCVKRLQVQIHNDNDNILSLSHSTG